MNTIYLNLVNRVTNVNYTFDLTDKILNDIRTVKHDLSQPELGGMVYKCLKNKDAQRAARALTMYLLKSQNWKIGKSMGMNCFNYYIDNGMGLGYIKALHTICVNSHEEAHTICLALDNEVETIHH